MYMAFLQATLYVPTEMDPGAEAELRFAEAEPLHGKVVYTTFTSLAELRRWRPSSDSHTALKGSELVTVLAPSALGSCLINPDGDVRGELYRHEVVMLAEAVPRLRAWRNPEESS